MNLISSKWELCLSNDRPVCHVPLTSRGRLQCCVQCHQDGKKCHFSKNGGCDEVKKQMEADGLQLSDLALCVDEDSADTAVKKRNVISQNCGSTPPPAATSLLPPPKPRPVSTAPSKRSLIHSPVAEQPAAGAPCPTPIPTVNGKPRLNVSGHVGLIWAFLY